MLISLMVSSQLSQKNFIAVYHTGMYADPGLMKWFTTAHAKISSKKLDMGKSCIRYKKPEDIPFDLIGQLAAKISPEPFSVMLTSPALTVPSLMSPEP